MSKNLIEVYIHWNQIKSEGGGLIFKALSTNNTLKVFDISWNSIGSGTISIANVVSEFFKTNKSLVHLDMSNNNFTYEETLEISKSLN